MQEKTILLATNNLGKLHEFKEIYASLEAINFISPKDINLELDVDETGTTYVENATLKAVAFAKESGMMCLADDSGLEVDVLDGAPGIYSARFSPLPNATDADRRKHMIDQIGNAPRPWQAKFKCAIVIANPKGVLGVFEGECKGEILSEERGVKGFGYDPIFQVKDNNKTMAELSEEIKNQISHRANAARATFDFLNSIS